MTTQKPRLLSLEEFSIRFFSPRSRPSPATLRRWATSGQIPARKIGKQWFVDPVAWEAADDPLVKRVLEATS